MPNNQWTNQVYTSTRFLHHMGQGSATGALTPYRTGCGLGTSRMWGRCGGVKRGSFKLLQSARYAHGYIDIAGLTDAQIKAKVHDFNVQLRDLWADIPWEWTRHMRDNAGTCEPYSSPAHDGDTYVSNAQSWQTAAIRDGAVSQLLFWAMQMYCNGGRYLTIRKKVPYSGVFDEENPTEEGYIDADTFYPHQLINVNIPEEDVYADGYGYLYNTYFDISATDYQDKFGVTLDPGPP